MSPENKESGRFTLDGVPPVSRSRLILLLCRGEMHELSIPAVAVAGSARSVCPSLTGGSISFAASPEGLAIVCDLQLAKGWSALGQLLTAVLQGHYTAISNYRDTIQTYPTWSRRRKVA